MTQQDIERLLAVLAAYRQAANKFIAKCESGQARSRETYADLKAAVKKHDESLPSNGEA